MAIEKSRVKVARFDTEFCSPHVRDTPMSSDNVEAFQRQRSARAVESDDDDEFDDCDSGAGSDDFDLLELGETGEEFCQSDNRTCSIPYELYDLPGLKDVLCMEVWNEVLTEEERFALSKHLPDLDNENFMHTLKELFSGDNLHFGCPIDKLFEMLKGGLCEPRVALYRQGYNFLQRRKHYHNLRKHHNSMVDSLCEIRDVWLNCNGYSIEEKLHVLNTMRGEKNLMTENMEKYASESCDKEVSADAVWDKKMNGPKLGEKASHFSGYDMGPASEVSSHGQKTTLEPGKNDKRNPKRTLKLSGPKNTSVKEVVEPIVPGVKEKTGRYGLGSPVPLYNKESMYDHTLEANDGAEMKAEEPGAFKWKKRNDPKTEEDTGSFMGVPISARNNLHARGWNKGINKLSDIKMPTVKPSNGSRKVKDAGNHLQFNRVRFGKCQKSSLSLRGSQRDLLDADDLAWVGGGQERLSPTNLSSNPSASNAKPKRSKMSREAAGLNGIDSLLSTEYKYNYPQIKFDTESLHGRIYEVGNRGTGTLSRSEDTESDSSDHLEEDKDDNSPMKSEWGYPSGMHTNNTQLFKRNKKNSYLSGDGSSHFTRKMEDYGVTHAMMHAGEKSKMHEIGYVLHPNDVHSKYFPGVTNVDDRQKILKMERNGHVEENHGDGFQMPSVKSSLTLGKKRKGDVSNDFSLPQPNYIKNSKFEEDLFWARSLVSDNGVSHNLEKKGQTLALSDGYQVEKSNMPLVGCETISKKRRVKNDLTYMDLRDKKEYVNTDNELRIDNASISKKCGKNKLEDGSGFPENEGSEPAVIVMEMQDVEAETKRQKKSFPLITPTVHSGFTFSIIHLLSAVRMAMITLLPEDSSEAEKHHDNIGTGQGCCKDDVEDVNMDANTCEPSAQANVPYLSVQEIVNRVRSNPGDPCILETQESLEDMVRGVLKLFSSRASPLGAKGWKPLVVFQKPMKRWLWIGPLSQTLSDSEEVTSPDTWGLPQKMLIKLVDSFANWFKNSQETLQQIGTLPDPPLTLMQINLDEKERFKDLRAQKSLNTIVSSSEEVKAYFHKEEVLRYLIPDRAFSYTAIDGKKSIVAPLRRCGGKPTSKARDHFMLKRNRPPHVTILCLVRDAAARLPGNIGTRADVCTLIRDSQYIVEDVTDAQVNQVVSGALDRLHYERDPCVQFDGDRKLWVYLHRDREEEDFEDDGTSSTKKWKRQKKETPEAVDKGIVPLLNDQVVEGDAGPGPITWRLKSVANSPTEDFDEDAYAGEPPA